MTTAIGDAIASAKSAQQFKTCRACGIGKSLDDFYASPGCKMGVRPDCIECFNFKRRERYENDPSLREKRKEKYLQNADAARDAARLWRLENLDRAKANGKAWREANPDKQKRALERWREENIEYVREYSRIYYYENREKINKKKKQFREENPEYVKERDKKYDRTGIDARRRATLKGRLSHVISSNVRRGIISGSKCGRRTFDLLGYTVDELRAHLEKQFQPGMSWDNYGEWHIDHIIPLSVFNYETPDNLDFKRAWALSNLQPLWALDNIRKNNRLTAPFQPSLAI